MNPKPKLVGDLDFVSIEAGREWKTQQMQQEQQLQTRSQESSNFKSDGNEQQTAPAATPTAAPISSQSLANIPKIIRVAAKSNSSVAISNIGHVYTWGNNDVGNLGLPKPDPATVAYVDPGQPIAKTTTLRQVHTYSFDSSHNVALPIRLDSIRHLNINSVGISPTFLWCLGKPRENEDDPNFGRTLYEIQEAKRQNALHVHYERMLRTVDNGSFSASGTTITTSSNDAPAEKEIANGSTSHSQVEQQEEQSTIVNIKVGSDEPEAVVGEVTASIDEGLSEEGSTSQHSKLADSSSQILDSAHFSETSNLEDSFSNTTPGEKKKRSMFSPKKFMKAIVRKASGSSSK
jgi:hypothetical protein